MTAWFEVKVGVHQGSVLSPLLFAIVMDALTDHLNKDKREFLYADDLAIIGNSWEIVSEKYASWKEALESKGLKVNIKKTKAMRVRAKRAKGPVSKVDPCSICGERVKSNSIERTSCKAWVHKRCSGVCGALTGVKDYECGPCKGVQIQDVDDGKTVKLGNDEIELVQEFCYLGDVIGSSGDVQSTVIARIRAGWRKFTELSQVLCGRVLSLKMKGRLYKSCIRSVMCYGCECWAMKKIDTRRMQVTEMRMIRMMCGKTLRDGISNVSLRERTGVEDIEYHLGESRLRWLGHLERMNDTNLIRKVREERVPGSMKRGRPKISWEEVVKKDMKIRGLSINDAQDRNKWRRRCRQVVDPG